MSLIYNRGKKKTLPEQKNEGVPDFRAAENAWNMEKQVDKSFIRETFYGQWRSVLSKQIQQHKFALNIDPNKKFEICIMFTITQLLLFRVPSM